MKKVIIFGIGYMFNKMTEQGTFENYEVVAYCDNDNSKWGEFILGKEIISPKDIPSKDYDEIIITTKKYENEIREQLINNYGIAEDAIVCAELKMDKYVAEVSFWRKKYDNEGGQFKNGHYKGLMLSIAEEENANFLKNKVIADFGCGPRGSLQWIDVPCIKLGIDVLVDVYMKEFGSCLIKHDMIYVKCGESYIPIGDEKVDCLFTINSLDHVDDLENMCNEIVRILKKGGTLIGSFNLNEPATYCEPQSLNYEKLERYLLKYFDIELKKYAYKGKDKTYQNFELGNLLEEIDEEKETILWVKAKKK